MSSNKQHDRIIQRISLLYKMSPSPSSEPLEPLFDSTHAFNFS